MRTKHFAALFLAVLTALPAELAQAQDTSPAQAGPVKLAPTLPTLYRHFLAYQLHLERKADELKQQGRNGEDFRTHFQKVLGFSDPEFTKLHKSALHLETQLKAKDDEISTSIAAFRATLPKGAIPKGYPLPPAPAALDSLFKQRQNIIQAEVDSLHKALTPAETERLESFLQKDFSRAVTVNPALPVRTRMPLTLTPGAAQ